MKFDEGCVTVLLVNDRGAVLSEQNRNGLVC